MALYGRSSAIGRATDLGDVGPKFYKVLVKRGLSIRQPWVELILRETKTIEVRSRSTSYRGELWLHAGKKVDLQACNRNNIDPGQLVSGAIVGVCELAACFAFDAATWDELRSQHLNAGEFVGPCFGWVLRSPRRTELVPYIGRLGLMKIAPEDV